MNKSRLSSLLTVIFFSYMLVLPPLSAGAAPGIIERHGESIALETHFRDEAGKTVTLKELIDRPALLSFAYFSCKDVCNTALSNIAELLGRMDSVPGKDFLVLTVSFDEKDGPKEAAYKKRNYTKAVGRPIDDDAWRFLTGDGRSIADLTSTAGFSFERTEKGFDHPAALAVISQEGRIVRYIYGSSYLPSDIEMALLEAREGTVAASVRKALVFCFSDEPGARSYVKGVLKAVGIGTLVLAAGLFIFLRSSGRPGKKDPQ